MISTLFLSPLLFSFFSCMKVEGCRAVLLSCLEAQAVVRLAQFPDVLLVGRVSVETFCSRLANDLPTRGARGGSRRVENPSLHHSVYCWRYLNEEIFTLILPKKKQDYDKNTPPAKNKYSFYWARNLFCPSVNAYGIWKFPLIYWWWHDLSPSGEVHGAKISCIVHFRIQ